MAQREGDRRSAAKTYSTNKLSLSVMRLKQPANGRTERDAMNQALKNRWNHVLYTHPIDAEREKFRSEEMGGSTAPSMLIRRGCRWLPPMILSFCSAFLGAATGIFIYMVSLGHLTGVDGKDVGGKEAIVVAVVSGFFSFVVLAFFSSLLTNIVDVCYVCFALDKDQGKRTNTEVHDIFEQIPTIKVPQGAVVENPTGDLVYGRA